MWFYFNSRIPAFQRKNDQMSACSWMDFEMGFPAPCPASGLDPQQDRPVAPGGGLSRLERGAELERVGRNDAVVVVGRQDHRRRIARPRLNIVQR